MRQPQYSTGDNVSYTGCQFGSSYYQPRVPTNVDQPGDMEQDLAELEQEARTALNENQMKSRKTACHSGSSEKKGGRVRTRPPLVARKYEENKRKGRRERDSKLAV
jgi:hypothetical protein